MDLVNLPRLFHIGAEFELPRIPDSVAEDKHINGVLGFWLSPIPHACASLGPCCYEVELNSDRRDLVYPLRDLYRAHIDDKPPEYYLGLRKQWQKDYDVVWVQDGWDCPGEIIVVNLDAIKQITRLDSIPDKSELRSMYYA